RVTVPYQARAAEHGAHRDTELRRSLQISRARLILFLVAAPALIWTITRAARPGWIALDAALFLIFGMLVAWHARVDERATWHGALRTVSLRSAARVERRW